jgi:hypothetical protein
MDDDSELWHRTAARLNAFAPRLIEAGWASRVLVNGSSDIAVEIDWTPAGEEKFGQLITLCGELGSATFQADDMFALWALLKLHASERPDAGDSEHG